MSVNAVAQTLDRPEAVRDYSGHSLGRNVICEGITLPAWKRILDLVIGLTALVLLSPLMLIVAALIRTTSPGPVLFSQSRVGHGGRPFKMLKFRTMICALPTQQQEDRVQRQVYYSELIAGAQPDPDTGLFRTKQDPRVTKIGEFLRLLSIDELPQLVNVIRGEMSLVGPRPALQWEAEMLTADQRRRHAVPPGMTGLWQVSGRNRISSLDMIKIDLRYVERLSLWLDLWILARTPWAVLFQRYTR